jgi:pentatricopeptide repeat protein
MPQKNKCTVAYNTLITACLKARDIRTARHLFDEMQRHKRSRRSVVSWNLIITGCARSGRDDMAVQCFERMVTEGEVAPDDGTLVVVLPVCGRTGNVGAGRWAHEYAKKTGLLDRTVHVANAVMDMYCKCGDVDSAWEVFMTTRQHSVVTWNTMITGFSLNGHGLEGIDLFQEMRRQGVEPNAVTFLAVLGCCAHAGAVDIGREIFQSMLSKHGIEPAIEHYGCMVDLFGRSGLLEEAHTLIQGMPMKPNAAIWGALLSACRAHAGLGITEVALKELINLEPWNSGNQGRRLVEAKLGLRPPLPHKIFTRSAGPSI